MKPVTRKRWVPPHVFQDLGVRNQRISLLDLQRVPPKQAGIQKKFREPVRVTWDPGPPRSIKIVEMEK